jgi:hypothetical protein
LSRFPSTVPYFQHSDEYRGPVRRNFHLVICVHGLEGNSAGRHSVELTYFWMSSLYHRCAQGGKGKREYKSPPPSKK